jgi:CRISPR-associated protein Csb1
VTSRSSTAILVAPRIVIEARLAPIAGTRFQPTGFPNLGAADFVSPDNHRNILVESAQSVANRLEAVAWDDESGDLVPLLRGLPYVRTNVDGVPTDSIREAHRLNSPFLRAIIEPLRERAGIKAAKGGKKTAKATAGSEESDAAAVVEESTSVDIRKLAAAVFAYDPNSVLHGVFMTNLVGLARLTRVVSGFIEAYDIGLVASGGVKNDRIDPSGKGYKNAEGKGGAEAGFGNVPFARSEYTAKEIVAFFSIDLALIRSYGLPVDAQQLLVSLALWKIQKFLAEGLRLRTACDLEVIEGGLTVKRPLDFVIPSGEELEGSLRSTIAACEASGLFVRPAVTDVAFKA